MKQKSSISSPKSGMNKDSSISDLKNTEYSFASNINTNSEVGDSFSVQLEPSNYFGVNFPLNYKVIGFKEDIIKNRTYYYLTNTVTDTLDLNYKRSSIGYVDNTINETFNQDVLVNVCNTCNKKNTLSPALENIVQTPMQTYVELVHDRCVPAIDIEEKGFNFNINFPILKIEIKQEKLNIKLYWDDNRNYFRNLNVTNIEEARAKNTFDYLHSQDIPCTDPLETPCIQIDKLLVEPKHSRIVLEAKEEQTGGNLKMGTYEFHGAYCDLMGNEMSQYCTPTNPISIFDENNNILSQTQTDSFTNFAIKINVKNLDVKHFKYYKIAVVERNNVANTQSVFLAGIYPTTDDTVVYTHSGSSNDDLYIARGNVSVKKRMDFNTLNAVKQKYTHAKGTMVTANTLFRYGLQVEEEINIQPVVNLLSSLHWNTAVANEHLYKSAVATSKYKGYMSNEVQTFALRLLYKDGGYSSNFPLIGRPKNSNDAQIVSDLNFTSLDANTPKCGTSSRRERWQIHNTAEEYSEQCYNFDSGGYLSQNEDVTKTCIIESVATISANSTTIEIENNFSDLKTYIEENYDDVINPASELYIPEIAPILILPYPLRTCTPIFSTNCDLPATRDSFKNVIGDVSYTIPNTVSLIIGKRYIIKVLTFGDNFSNAGYIKQDEYFTATATTPLIWTTTEVLIEEKTLIESTFPSQYSDTLITNKCNIYITGSWEGVEIDGRTNPLVVPADGEQYISLMPCYRHLAVRNKFDNLTTITADSVQNVNSSTSYIQSYFNDYGVAFDINDLIGTKPANPIQSGWSSSLHKEALWFKTDTGKKRFILEVTPQKNVDPVKDFVTAGNEIRVSFYAKKDSPAPFFTKIVDLTGGYKFLFEKTLTGYSITEEGGLITPILGLTNSSFYIATDCKIVSQKQSVITNFFGIVKCNSAESDAWRIAPTNGCYSIVTRDIEFSSVEVNWQSIQINKLETYSSNCTFKIPKIDSCNPKPYKKGKFAYWESTETYADNKQLFDSSTIKIKLADLQLLSVLDRDNFIENYTNGLTAIGDYNYKVNILGKKIVDFRCEPIRHFKMPDNTVAPFLIDMENYQKNADSLIFPLGVNIDSNVVKTILDISVKNNLITQKQRDNVQGYEILRGDNSIHKSVIANGIASDMYNYQEGNDKVHYSNFPFNDLGSNKFAFEKNTKNLIKHPYNSTKNHLFSFLSPDVFLTKPSIPTEVTLQGFMLGNAETGFASVDKHPQWTVLGEEAKKIATKLAIAESVLEIAVKVGELVSTQWVTLGVGASGGSIPGAIGTITAAVSMAIGAYVKIGKYRYEWLKTFRDLARSDNFAEFQYSYGKYNKFIKPARYNTNYIRGLTIRNYLKDSDYNIVDNNDGTSIKVNNWLRESSVLLSTGSNKPFNYPLNYINADNNNNNSNSSTFTASQVGCKNGERHTRDIGSPYFSLKNYIPDQWGTLDSIKWLTTNYIFDLNEDTTCKPIFGGTVCISRFSWRKKVPLFRKNDIGSADKLPFKYSRYSNIGDTRFYCDYETENDGIYDKLTVPFPDISSSLGGFDCTEGKREFYVRPPSKFYLFIHGVSDFLVQSEINCNFRYAGKEPQDQFYQKQNLSDWLQESKLPIVEPNTFYYNNTYTQPVSNTPFKSLDKTYDKETEVKRNKQDNAWIWTERDVNENDLTDPWTVFKPLNKEETATKNGKLIDLRDIESGQFYARYEDQLHLYSEIQDQAQRTTVQNRELGTGFLYGRPVEMKATDLGFAGTQNTDMSSTPYGHFSVDAKRGRIIKTDANGQGLEVISEMIQGKPSGMKQWFREHLPFKILRYIPNLNTNNKFKGIGLNIWYDDRNSRVFFTKRDYILKQGVDKTKFKYIEKTQQLLYENIEVFYDNITLFKDVSWTIAYKPTEGTWNSFFTFYPDYTSHHQNYFQTGFNWGESKSTLWNHLMNNQSFGVFQGKFNPSTIEFPVANENVDKILNSLSLKVEGRRYSSQWDFSVDKNIGFNELQIWNNTNHSGILGLNPQKTLIENRKYPFINGNKQEILFTSDEDKQNINCFFNRIVNQDNNIPIFIRDENNIFKTVSNDAVKFTGKRVMERMKGNTFMVTLTNTNNSRHNIILENTINKETIYE